MDTRHRIDITLVVSVLVVVSAGIFTLYTQESILEEGDGRWIKQLIYFIIGLAIVFGMRRANYQILGGYAVPAYIVCIVLLLITLLMDPIKGARSWIPLGPINLQTSELAKLATIILIAKYLELKERELDKIPSLLIPFGIAVVPMMLLVVQPDFGGAFSFAPVLMSMLFIAGADIFHIGSVLVFFSVSLSIPLYLEYHKITLVQPLLVHLTDIERVDLLPAARILQTDIWRFIENGVGAIPSTVADQDRQYLENVASSPELMSALAEASRIVRFEGGGFLLAALGNLELLAIFGVILSLIAGVLFVLRMTQGNRLIRLRNFYIPLGVLGISLLTAVAFQTAYSFKRHQVIRITAFINPERFPHDRAYHTRASKAAIGSGQVTGRGMFHGDMTMGRTPLVPEAETDFIYAAWAERTGFIGSVLLLLFVLAIPLRGLMIAFESRDRFGSLLASGISFLFFYHMAFNAGIALGLLPVTGLPLSFMSYGGSHLLTCMLGVGILLSVHRRRHAN